MNHEVSPYWVWEKELPPQICNYIIKKSINLEEDKWVRGIAGNDNKDDKENRKNDTVSPWVIAFENAYNWLINTK